MSDFKRDKSLWPVAVLFCAPVLVLDALVGSMYVRDVRSGFFEPTSGTVTKSEIRPGEQGAVHFDLEYTYTVNGRRHTGTKYHPQAQLCGGPWYWYAARDANPVGASVTVYYDPADPDTAYLATGLRSDVPFVLLLLFPFNLLALSFVRTIRRPASRSFDPALRCVRETPAGWFVRPNPDTRFLPTALVVLWLVAFFGFIPALVLGAVFTEFERLPPWWVGGGVWAVVLGAAFLLTTRTSGRGLLRFDASTGTLTFFHPKSKAWVAVVRERLLGLDVATVEGRRDRFSPDELHVVSLRWRDSLGGERAALLAEFANDADARALAGWLSERLGVPVVIRPDA